MRKFNTETKSGNWARLYENRRAKVKANVEGRVLFDVYEGDKVIVENMVRPAEAFERDYN